MRIDVHPGGVGGEGILADRAHLEPEARPGQQEGEDRHQRPGRVEEQLLVEERLADDRDVAQQRDRDVDRVDLGARRSARRRCRGRGTPVKPAAEDRDRQPDQHLIDPQGDRQDGEEQPEHQPGGDPGQPRPTAALSVW